MKFEKNGCTYISMPGVPFEMKAIMNESILPELQKSSQQVIIHRTILTEGIGESMLADRIEDWETALPPFIKLAYLPQPGIVRLRLTATGTQRDALETAIAKAEASLQPLVGSFIFGYDNDTLESVTGNLLKQKGLTLSTAESCTGGTIAQMITSIPGSSAYFKGSVVAYANEIKQNLLGVTESCLSENGAVSEATVRAMVEGVCQLMNTDCAIAVSGIAGPDGGTPEKPVGLTWIAVNVKGNIAARQFRFGNHRERNIRRASLSALNMLRNNLLEYTE
jgi:nicotinamide-nucleotide amidase